jgi:hypothetical protein
VIVDEGHVQGVDATGSTQDGRLDVMQRHGLDGREKGPLVAVRDQVGIDEDTEAVVARVLLQRQGDQVAETPFGHRVLVGIQAVVGRQFELASTRTGVAEDGRSQAPGIPC